MPSYITTVTARDQVGIIHGVASALRERRGNVLELSQTVMRGFFTIIIEVEFPETQDPQALQDLIKRRNDGYELSVTVLPCTEPTRDPVVPDGERYILTVLGQDRPGNIEAIAAILARRGVNIVDLSTQVDTERFSMIMEVFMPPDETPTAIRDEIVEFGREIGLDAYVQHENIFLATAEPRPVRIRSAPHRDGIAVDRL